MEVVEPGINMSAPALRFAPSRCRRVFLMYTSATSLPNLYIRNIIPHVRASLFWSVWPYRGGAKRSFSTYVEEEFSEVRHSKLSRLGRRKTTSGRNFDPGSPKPRPVAVFVARIRSKRLRLATDELL